MEAYTYSVRYLKTNQIYYGVRKSKTFDLGTIYFTSSKYVKKLLEDNDLSCFEFKLRKKFDSFQEAIQHESNFLRRINAIKNPKVLNRAISSPVLCYLDNEAEGRRKKSLSKTMKKLWQDPTYKNNQKFSKITHEEAKQRGSLGGSKRAENYKNGLLVRKKREPPIYKNVLIIRNGVQKQIKANQVPAYVKCGWTRMVPAPGFEPGQSL